MKRIKAALKLRGKSFQGVKELTKQEVIKLLVLIESVYSNFITKNDMVLRWFNLCSEMDYEKVMGRLLDHLRKSPYPPTMIEIAVLNGEKDEFPKHLKTWFKEDKESMEQVFTNGKQKSLSWMLEYSPRNLEVNLGKGPA
jgi:hypothetical protein